MDAGFDFGFWFVTGATSDPSERPLPLSLCLKRPIMKFSGIQSMQNNHERAKLSEIKQ